MYRYNGEERENKYGCGHHPSGISLGNTIEEWFGVGQIMTSGEALWRMIDQAILDVIYTVFRYVFKLAICIQYKKEEDASAT